MLLERKKLDATASVGYYSLLKFEKYFSYAWMELPDSVSTELRETYSQQRHIFHHIKQDLALDCGVIKELHDIDCIGGCPKTQRYFTDSIDPENLKTFFKKK